MGNKCYGCWRSSHTLKYLYLLNVQYDLCFSYNYQAYSVKCVDIWYFTNFLDPILECEKHFGQANWHPFLWGNNLDFRSTGLLTSAKVCCECYKDHNLHRHRHPKSTTCARKPKWCMHLLGWPPHSHARSRAMRQVNLFCDREKNKQICPFTTGTLKLHGLNYNLYCPLISTKKTPGVVLPKYIREAV